MASEHRSQENGKGLAPFFQPSSFSTGEKKNIKSLVIIKLHDIYKYHIPLKGLDYV